MGISFDAPHTDAPPPKDEPYGYVCNVCDEHHYDRPWVQAKDLKVCGSCSVDQVGLIKCLGKETTAIILGYDSVLDMILNVRREAK